MISKRETERAIVNESIMRMANEMREDDVFDEGDLPSDMPGFVKDIVRQATPIALALFRLSELSKWN